MFFKLLLFFLLVPIVELAVIIQVGTSIGTFNTIVIVVVTAVLGAYLVRKQGLSVFYRLRATMNRGEFPAEEMIDGAMVLVAGAVLLTPGFVTDALGFLLVFPVTRGFIKAWGKKHIRRRVSEVNVRSA